MQCMDQCTQGKGSREGKQACVVATQITIMLIQSLICHGFRVPDRHLRGTLIARDLKIENLVPRSARVSMTSLVNAAITQHMVTVTEDGQGQVANSSGRVPTHLL
jgi:hypothetical protein